MAGLVLPVLGGVCGWLFCLLGLFARLRPPVSVRMEYSSVVSGTCLASPSTSIPFADVQSRRKDGAIREDIG
jgi:hypothetical protein